MSYSRDVIIVVLAAIFTFITRALPFAIFGRKGKPPKQIENLGKLLPSAVMAILIIYCLRDISFASSSTFLPQLISVVVVAVLHIIKRNNLISIGCGTLCYMILIQFVFK